MTRSEVRLLNRPPRWLKLKKQESGLVNRNVNSQFFKIMLMEPLTSTGPNPPQFSWKSAGLFMLDLLKLVVIAAVSIFLIRYYLFQPFYVKGASMEPNFDDHEYLVISKLTYRLRTPQRGDVIVFRYPGDQREYFLKRIIGLPGERVKVANGQVTIYNIAHPEGAKLEESYLPKDLATMGDKTSTVAENQYFVLGDNRGNSFDSRRFGPIDQNLIIGQVWLRGWPISRVERFAPPAFNL